MEEDEYRIMRHIESTYWWFKGKQFLVDMILQRHCDYKTVGRILDIGTGTGAIFALLQRYGQVSGIDVSAVAIQMLAKAGHATIAQSDAETAIPFKSDTFSIVTCLDVLEHLENDRGLLDEMARVCKPGGIILITVPAMGLLWSRHDVALHHKRRYTKRQLLNQVGSLHCKVVKASYFNSVLFLPIAAVRILRSLVLKDSNAKSDFFMNLPEWLNASLFYLYRSELAFLGSFDFPFGVSIVLVMQKPDRR